MNKILFFLNVIAFFFLYNCCISHEKQIDKVKLEWAGKKIIIPSNIRFKSLNKDTLCSYLWEKQYKIFIYVDSTGCASCKMGMFEWKGKIQLCKQQNMDIGFIFVVHPSNFHSFEADILMSYFDYPIIYDYNNDFEKLNHFPPAPYRTFLLDKENRVQVIGSPINNPEIWEQYKSIILKQ